MFNIKRIDEPQEVVRVMASDYGYMNVVEYADLGEDGEVTMWHYELRSWFYGSYTVVCSWESPARLEIKTESD
jgi:hypothetical protein